MPDPALQSLSIDTTAADVIADLVTTFEAVRIDGQRTFDIVQVIQDPQSFFVFQDAFAGNVVGIVDARPDEEPGMSNADEKINYLNLSVVVGLYESTGMDGDVGAVVEKLANLVDVARQAVLVDRTRGGLCDTIMWGGKLIRGTETWGQPKQLKRTAKIQPLFFATMVPIQCGWRTAAT